MIGIDIVEIKQIKNIYRKHGRLFLEKILNEKEIADLFTEQKGKFFQRLGCYIASKEAIFKACSREELDWREISISNIKLNPQVQIKRPDFNKRLNLTFSSNKDMVLSQALVI